MEIRQHHSGLWTLDFPYRMLGMNIGRRSTVIRLRDGRLMIHSTAPFRCEDIETINALGRPAFLVEATLFHDTFSVEGRKAFPEAEYFVPDPQVRWAKGARPLVELEPLLNGEIEIRAISGLASGYERVFFHPASRTLIVCDLLFNIVPPVDGFTRFMFRWINGAYNRPAITRLYRTTVKDKMAFRDSVASILRDWNFDRIILGHGAIVESDVKTVLNDALAKAFGTPE